MSNPIRLEYAERLAKRLVTLLSPFVTHVEVAGSIRRQKTVVGDIELVARPAMHGDLWGADAFPVLDPLRLELQKIGRIVKGGDRYIRVHLTRPDVYADIFLCWPPAQWGSILAIRTGPAALGKYVVTRCRERGIHHSHGHAIRWATGEILSTQTEEEFFALADLPCVAPPQREQQLLSLLPG